MALHIYGQTVVVVPSERLVITRFGTTYDLRMAMVDICRLTAGTIAALHATASEGPLLRRHGRAGCRGGVQPPWAAAICAACSTACSPMRRARNSIDTDAEHRMAALPGPLGVGKGGEEARRLLVLAGDRIEKHSRRLVAREACAPVALLIEVGEDRVVLVEEPPDPEPVDVDDDFAHMGQRLDRRPLALARGPGELAGRRGLDGAPEDGCGRSESAR